MDDHDEEAPLAYCMMLRGARLNPGRSGAHCGHSAGPAIALQYRGAESREFALPEGPRRCFGLRVAAATK
jgi:hypothetical protein